MKIYITDKNKVTRYKLPEKIDESFLFPYNYDGIKTEYQINVISNENEWIIKNDDSVNIVHQDSFEPETTLREYSFHRIKFKDINDLNFIFISPSNETNSKRYNFNTPTISIGSAEGSSILYRNEITHANHANIVKEETGWYITANQDDNYRTYVNDKRITRHKLKPGDIIFINGLKIVWMNTFIKINNPNESVMLNSGIYESNEPDSIDNSKYVTETNDDANIELFKDDEYFFHRPRLRTVIEKAHVEIDAPPENQNKDDIPFIFQIGTGITLLFTSFTSGINAFMEYKTGQRTFGEMMPTLLLAVAMLLGSFVLPKAMKVYQKRRKKKREELRQTKYSEYLKEKENEINVIMNQQAQILRENYITLQECANISLSNKRKIWEREITDDDFLTVRLGTGTRDAELEIEAPQKHFTLDEDNLMNMVFDVVNKSKELHNVPITISYIQNKVSALVTECSFEEDFINGVILQLITYHSSNDLKIVFLTNKRNEKKWEYIKNLPHNWNGDKTLRYFATNLEEMKNIMSSLEKEFNDRKETQNDRNSTDENGESLVSENVYKNFAPYYLVITDDFKTAKQLEFINLLLGIKENYGFSLLLLEKSMQNLPNVCNTFTYVMDSSSCIFEKELSSSKQLNFKAEFNPTIDMKVIGKEIANIPIAAHGGLAVLPNSISFLEMYNVGKIEQLNILNRWKTSNPIATLQVPIGVHPSGDQFKLDLHEKFHGPHGLIAGSTGSGKSEFIITYLLSLAVNYHPYEVQFVLIDYKGGGLAGAFENRETGLCIPHLAGTITNLDTSEMNRTLVSIESELKRRQRIFNEVRDSLGESTIDIYKYQRLYREGVIKEPISHLFIVSDEFAELKSQQPEFLNQLVSTARIGRSLGVHLILATQKPSGVVNDQIWSNSKFKVCLKVQTKQDSMEMLKRPEAASIKETGRFYLQVGYDELFEIGQSAWAGAKYIPTEKITKKVDNSLSFVNNNGYIIKSINDIVKKETVSDQGEQLTNIVKYLASVAEKEQIVCKKLWLESIPEFIYINNLKQKYKHTPTPFLINPVIGEYDNPTKQQQNVLKLDLTNNGNTVIYGAAGMGKENLLSTIIFGSTIEHSPDEINFYILDFGAETLRKFADAPHVGEVMFADDSEKIINYFSMISNEIERRKDIFSEYSGNYVDYVKESGSTLPLITTVINSFESFVETYPRLEDKIMSILRDGPKYGINFICTTSVYNGIKIRLTQYFTNKLVLQMAQDSDYRTLLSGPRNLFPAKKFGRGLVKVDDNVVEFQSAYITEPDQISKVIKDVNTKLNETYTKKANPVPTLPKTVLGSMLTHEVKDLSHIPVGIKKNSLAVATFDFNKPNVTPILSNNIDELASFTKSLISEFNLIPNLKTTIVDLKGLLEELNNGINNYANGNFMAALNFINTNILNDASGAQNMYVFFGIGENKIKFNVEEKKLFNDLMTNIAKCKNNYAVIIDEYNSYKGVEIDPWHRIAIDKANGIWIGEGAGVQISIKISNMSLDEKKVDFPHIGYTISKGKHTLIKHMVDKEEVENEE